MAICPKCDDKFLKEVETIKQVRVDACKSCKGVWFDSGELEEIFLIAAKGLKVSKYAKQVKFLCPRCQIELYSFKYPQTDISIEMCKKCDGIWLDQNELTIIQGIRLILKKYGKLKDYEPEEEEEQQTAIIFVNKAYEALTKSNE